MEYEGTIFEKLVDPMLYTGTHKHRFDAYGRGKGLHGSREPYELLDSGSMFENSRSNNAGFRGGTGSSTGDASDRAESLWMKSLRASIHSPSLAKKLHVEKVGQSSFRSARNEQQSASSPTSRPLIQAWVLDEEGRLLFDDQRTRSLLEEDVYDAATILSHKDPAPTEGQQPEPLQRRGYNTLNPANYSATAMSANKPRYYQQQQQPHQRLSSVPDTMKQHSVTNHMRRLLFEDELSQQRSPLRSYVDDNPPAYVVAAPDGDDTNDERDQSRYEPQEHFRRWYHQDATNSDHAGEEEVMDEAGGAPHSLYETMQMLSAYEAQAEQMKGRTGYR